MSRNFITVFPVFLCCIQRITALSIQAITPVVNLTQTFAVPNYPKNWEFEIDGGYMTYYIDPNDSTKTKYLWLGTNIRINASTVASYILSDVFTELFAEYPAINGTLDIAKELSPNATYADELYGDFVCTSPQTNDIMSCWVNSTHSERFFRIDCRLYFVQSSTFSNIIHVTNNQNGINLGFNVLCFNDSYFIPYSHTQMSGMTPSDVILYGTLIDLKGVVIYSGVELKNIGTVAGIYDVVSVVGNEFNPREIDSRATNLFMINYEFPNTTTNVAHLVGLYGYYTSISDANFPIYIYNETELKSRLLPWVEADETGWAPNAVLDWNSTCCYISMYCQGYYYNNSNAIYGIITDAHGSKIKVAQYPNFEDLLLINGADTRDVLPQIIDLPMISSEFVHYFGVVYGEYKSETDSANATMIRVYYLEFDENNAQFDLVESGEFEAVQLVNDNNPSMQTWFGSGVQAYRLPQTNYICFVWTQTYSSDFDYDYFIEIYGQTFVID